MAERRHSVSSRSAFDRFIPYRPHLDVESSHARLMSSSSVCAENEPGQYKSPVSKEYTRLLSETTHSGDGKILPISESSPKPSPFHNRMKPWISQSPDQGYHSPGVHQPRRIPTSPECIMDMPGLRDDFYTNLLDWSHLNLIAVALFQSTYVWNAESKDCKRIEIHFPEPESGRFYISALCWSNRGKSLAIADSEGDITICDVEKMKSQRKFLESSQEKCSIGALQWTDFGIVSGNRKGKISVHDHRCKRASISLETHTRNGKEVCGLKLAAGTSYIASGADDGIVKIWDLRMSKLSNTIAGHSACVKAISWCPWRQSVLATGGGSSDGHIRLWHAHTGENLGETCTKSQICGLLWSEEYFELVSALGSATPDKNDIILWNMKKFTFEPMARLRQHMARPLHIAMSPDKTTIASAGADEALCLWNAFPKRKARELTLNCSPLNMFKYIR